MLLDPYRSSLTQFIRQDAKMLPKQKAMKQSIAAFISQNLPLEFIQTP